MFKKILIPTDGSELSDKAVENGTALARTLGATVVGLHVVPAPYVTVAGGEVALYDPNTFQRLQEAVRADGSRYLDRIETAARKAGVPFARVLLEEVQPWKGILDAAARHHCDLITMAAHGRHGLAALVLGSETNKVLTHGKIPVLVYR